MPKPARYRHYIVSSCEYLQLYIHKRIDERKLYYLYRPAAIRVIKWSITASPPSWWPGKCMAMVCGNERTQGTHYRHLLPLLFHLLFVVIYYIRRSWHNWRLPRSSNGLCSPKGQWATKMIPLSIQGRTSTLEMSSAVSYIYRVCILFVCGSGQLNRSKIRYYSVFSSARLGLVLF